MRDRDDTAQRRRLLLSGAVLAFLAVAIYAVVLMKFFVSQ